MISKWEKISVVTTAPQIIIAIIPFYPLFFGCANSIPLFSWSSQEQQEPLGFSGGHSWAECLELSVRVRICHWICASVHPHLALPQWVQLPSCPLFLVRNKQFLWPWKSRSDKVSSILAVQSDENLKYILVSQTTVSFLTFFAHVKL